MVSPIQEAARRRGARNLGGGVSFLPPARVPQYAPRQDEEETDPKLRPVVPVQPQQGQPQGDQWANFNANFTPTPYAEPEEQDEGFFGGGVGGFLANSFEGALSAVDVGRRAITLGIEEASELTDDLFDTGTLNANDDRSNWEKLKDISYGVEDWLDDSDWFADNQWAGSTLGFIGDVALDPLTYLTAGVGGVAGKAGRSTYAIKTAAFGRKTAQEVTERLVKEGVEDAAINRTRAGIIQHYDNAAADIGRFGPGVIKDDTEYLTQLGKADTNLLKELGLADQAVRFGRPLSPGKGAAIPGTAGIARGTNRAVAGARARFYDSKVGGKLASWRTGENVQKAHEVLRSGNPVGNLTLPRALALISFDDGSKQASNAFRGEWGSTFERLAQQTDDKTMTQLTHQIEGGQGGVWTEFAEALAKDAEEAGVVFPDGLRKNYVPHIWTEEGREKLRREPDLRKALDITIDHIDDPSGVTLSRKLGQGKHEVNGVEVDFGTGTVADINAAMKRHFGVEQALDDNITSIYANYVTRLASDVGVVRGLEEVAEQFPDLLKMGEDISDIFIDLVDEAASKELNDVAANDLRARWSKMKQITQQSQKRVSDSLVAGSHRLNEIAEAELADVRMMRDTTRKELADITKVEDSIVAERDRWITALDGETVDLDRRIQDLQQELRDLDKAQAEVSFLFDNLDVSDLKKQRARERATRVSAAKRRIRSEQRALKADRDQLESMSNRLRTVQQKHDIAYTGINEDSFIELMASDSKSRARELPPEWQREQLDLEPGQMTEAARLREINDSQFIPGTRTVKRFDLEEVSQDILKDFSQRKASVPGVRDGVIPSTAASPEDLVQAQAKQRQAGSDLMEWRNSIENDKLQVARIRHSEASTALEQAKNKEEQLKAAIARSKNDATPARPISAEAKGVVNHNIKVAKQKIKHHRSEIERLSQRQSPEMDVYAQKVNEWRGGVEVPKTQHLIGRHQPDVTATLRGIRFHQDKIAKLDDEIAAMQRRLEPPSTTARKPKKFNTKRATEARRKATAARKEAEKEYATAQKQLDPLAKKLDELEAGVRNADDEVAATARQVDRQIPARTEADVEADLAALHAAESEYLRRAKQKDIAYGDQNIPLGGDLLNPTQVMMGRNRLPSRESIIADLAALEESTLPYVKPTSKRKSGQYTSKTKRIRDALENRNAEFSYADGDRSLKSISERVLADTAIATDYRDNLVMTEAITLEDAWQHVGLQRKLKDAIKNYEANPSWANSQKLEAASGQLRRANEFMAKYAIVTSAGEVPSDGLARVITRDIMDREIKSLTDELARMEAHPERWVDAEVEQVTDLIAATVEDLDQIVSARKDFYQGRKYNKSAPWQSGETVSTPLKIAAAEKSVEILEESIIPSYRREIGNAKRRLKRSIANHDEAATAKHQRTIAEKNEMLDQYLQGLQTRKEVIADLYKEEMTPDVQRVRDAIAMIQDGQIGPEVAESLRELFGDAIADRVMLWSRQGFPTAESDEDLQMFLQNFLRGHLTAGEAMATNADLRDMTLIQAMESGGLLATNGSDAIIEAMKIQVRDEYDRAQRMFNDVFEQIGLTRGPKARSKEITVGYNEDRGRFSRDAAREAVANLFENQRGLTGIEAKRRDLEMRLARLRTVNKGLGKTTRARPSMSRRSAAGGYATEAYGQTQQLPKIAPEFPEGKVSAEALEAMTPQERMSEVARAGRVSGPQEVIEDARLGRRDARSALRSLPDDEGDIFIDWRDTLFGVGSQPRPQPILSKQAMKMGAESAPRPSGAFNRGGPSSQQAALNSQLQRIIDAEIRLGKIGRDSAAEMETLQPQVAGLTDQIAGREAEILKQKGVTKEIGTSLTPDVDAARARREVPIQEDTAAAQKELTQAQAEKQAVAKAKAQKITEFEDRLEQPTTLRKQGERDVEAAVKRVEKANDTASKTRKTNVAKGYKHSGAQAIAEQMDSVMNDLTTLRPADREMTKGLMADAVELEKRASLDQRTANALEGKIAKAEAGELKTVTESQLLAGWTRMADELGVDAYMENELARSFTRVSDQLSQTAFWDFIEKYTAFFKTYATARPDFHIRNALSAGFMNASDGVPISANTRALGVWRTMRRNGVETSKDAGNYVQQLRKNPKQKSGITLGRGKGKHEFTNSELADAIDAAFATGAGGQFAERGVGPQIGSTSKLLNNPYTRLSRKMGEFVEGPARLAVALDSISKGTDDPRLLYARIARLHFDYTDTSMFDQKARRLIPFWTFMSRNLPLQFTQAMGKPRWYAGYNSFRRNFSGEADPLTPEYWGDSGGFRMPGLEGLPGTGDNEVSLVPGLAHNDIRQQMQDLGGLLTWSDPGKMATSLNPLFTTPAELAMKQDMFTGRQYDDDDIRELGGAEQILAPLLGLIPPANAGDGFYNEQWINAARSLVPTWDLAARMAPELMTGNQSELDAQRQGETYWRRAGLPIRVLTDAQKEQTERNMYYEELDAERVAEAKGG